jgi:hypothetical protein
MEAVAATPKLVTHGLFNENDQVEEFSLFRYDPLNQVLAHIGLTENGVIKTFHTILFFFALTWVPVAILSAIQGVAVSDVSKQSFLYDFAAYAQFFIAVPIFIYAERFIDDEIRFGLTHFTKSGILSTSEILKLKTHLMNASRALMWKWPIVVALLAGYLATMVWGYIELTNQSDTWHALSNGSREYFTLAGGWSTMVSIPIMVFWHFRWVWKILIWYWILWKISKLDLVLHPAHPDRYGGLGFLSRLQSKFAILIFAVGCVFAATMCYKLVIEKATFAVATVWLLPILYFVFAPSIFLTPLFFFSSKLSAAKRIGLLEYGIVGTYYASKIDKLVKPLNDLQEQDIQKLRDDLKQLSDFQNYFTSGLNMHSLPYDFKFLRRLFVSALGPMLPLLLELSPILKSMAELVIGVIEGTS